jgi:hypothetical protein
MAVIVLPNTDPIKACNCNASIIAEMSAQATCTAGLKI